MAPDQNALIVKFPKEAFYAVVCGAVLSALGTPLIWNYASMGAGTDLLLQQARSLLIVSGGVSLLPFFIISYFAVERREAIIAFAGLCWVAAFLIVGRGTSDVAGGSALYWLLGATISLALTQSLFLIFARLGKRS